MAGRPARSVSPSRQTSRRSHQGLRPLDVLDTSRDYFLRDGLGRDAVLAGRFDAICRRDICGDGIVQYRVLSLALMLAAVLGDSANYAIGKYFGHYLINHKATARFIKKEYLAKTHAFYEKHGGKTIIFARFVPIVRTFAPFVAGIGEMSYLKFFSYNVIGGIVWVALFTLAGFFFGNIPIIRKNFTLVIYVIIFLSILPPAIEIWRHKRAQRAAADPCSLLLFGLTQRFLLSFLDTGTELQLQFKRVYRR